MTLADYSITAFALLNGGRVLAYLPQIVRICRDPNGARAVSVTTWSLFMAANIATVSYATFVSADAIVATVFALNAVGCLAIVGATLWKRCANVSREPAVWYEAAPPGRPLVTGQGLSDRDGPDEWTGRVGAEPLAH